MLTRRSLLQAAAAVITGSAVAPQLIAADPVATEYGRLGRVRYIFPLQFPIGSITESGEMDDPIMDIRTLLHATARVSVVQVDYDLAYRCMGRSRKYHMSAAMHHWPLDMTSPDSLTLKFRLNNEWNHSLLFLPSTVTVHGITTKQAAPGALRLG